MKKILSILIVLSLIMTLTACDKEEETAPHVALIIGENGALENNHFNLSAWNGINEYCDDYSYQCQIYEPEARNDEAYTDMVHKAVQDGADVIVATGYLLQNAIYIAQDTYPDIHFILVDEVPNNGESDEAYESKISENTYSVMFAEEQAGFLAGYAAVKEGFRDLGFFGGMSLPAVKRFGYGYIQGAEYAAEELKLEKGSVNLRYLYTGDFFPSPEYQSRAELWYSQGTEVIFACGGAMGQSVMQAAGSFEKWVIGVDSDQSAESETVITSSVKVISTAVYNALETYHQGSFSGGKMEVLGVEADGVGLVMDNGRFESFDEAEYNNIYGLLKSDESLRNSIRKDDTDIGDIPLEYVNLEYESLR